MCNPGLLGFPCYCCYDSCHSSGPFSVGICLSLTTFQILPLSMVFSCFIAVILGACLITFTFHHVKKWSVCSHAFAQPVYYLPLGLLSSYSAQHIFDRIVLPCMSRKSFFCFLFIFSHGAYSSSFLQFSIQSFSSALSNRLFNSSTEFLN